MLLASFFADQNRPKYFNFKQYSMLSYDQLYTF